MPNYQLWALDDAYAKQAMFDQWLSLDYRIGLNQIASASINLPANDDKIPDAALMERLQIKRDGTLVWAGIFQTESWEIGEAAPQNDIHAVDALDNNAYLLWRTIERPAGADFHKETGAADDVAKAYVLAHLGTGAVAARRFTDMTIEADATAVASATKLWVGGSVYEHLQRLGAEKSFYWRMVPTASGCEFQTAYPLWGLDRSKGNGVNDELVFTLDRKNVARIAYKKDLSAHFNHMYMGGAGEGQNQLMVERADATYVSDNKRRELWVPATSYISTAGLQAEGDRVIEERRPFEIMDITPAVSAITPSNLGDKVTVFARRYDRSFEFDAIIMAINFAVTPDGVERAVPELVAA